MELKSMTFMAGEDGAVPDTVTVTMGIGEAAAIARVFGMLNGRATSRLGVHDSSVYDTLVGDVFNRFWEDGLNDVLPQNFTLRTLNDAV